MRLLESTMKDHSASTPPAELLPLLEFTRRVGSDPLLTQGSTGNSSVKVDGALWIKRSGKWMADADRKDIFVPLDLKFVQDCLRDNIDPTQCYPCASLEAAMHAVLPHKVVLHVHCVNTIAWAVLADAPVRLRRRLDGLAWSWIPYISSGLPLSREIGHALSAQLNRNVFILGNHGLVIAGEDINEVEQLLQEVRQRLAIQPRPTVLPDLSCLSKFSDEAGWSLPADDSVHVLATDPSSQAILERGCLYPCQAIFFEPGTGRLFRPIAWSELKGHWRDLTTARPFLIIQGHGVMISNSLTPAELAMMSGLVQVLQRLQEWAEIRYLTEAEIASLSGEVALSYRRRGACPAVGSL